MIELAALFGSEPYKFSLVHLLEDIDDTLRQGNMDGGNDITSHEQLDKIKTAVSPENAAIIDEMLRESQ